MLARLTKEFWELLLDNENNGTRPGVVWQDQSIIDQATNTLSFSMIANNRYLDLDDYKNPIHIRSHTEVGIATNGTTKSYDYYVNENEAELNDDYLSVIFR